MWQEKTGGRQNKRKWLDLLHAHLQRTRALTPPRPPQCRPLSNQVSENRCLPAGLVGFSLRPVLLGLFPWVTVFLERQVELHGAGRERSQPGAVWHSRPCCILCGTWHAAVEREWRALEPISSRCENWDFLSPLPESHWLPPSSTVQAYPDLRAIVLQFLLCVDITHLKYVFSAL